MKKAGFTLIEVVVAIAIFAITMVGISFALTTSMTMQVKSRSQYDVNSYGKSIIDFLKVNRQKGEGQYRIYFNNVSIGNTNGDSLIEKLSAMNLLGNNTALNLVTVDYFKSNQAINKTYKFGAFIDIKKSKKVEYSNLYQMTIIICDLKETKLSTKEYYIER
jgi:prepilin-type N-terminal cleavage/methylation domain-containing protein